MPLIAQEPPALRPRVTDMMTPDRLAGMISAMETLLANRAAGSGAPLDTSPDALPDALNGAYLRDWSDLRDGLSDAEPHYPTRAGVRLFTAPLPYLFMFSVCQVVACADDVTVPSCGRISMVQLAVCHLRISMQILLPELAGAGVLLQQKQRGVARISFQMQSSTVYGYFGC